MSKTITFEYWKLTVIDKKNDKIIEIDDVLENVERKPLDISKDENRYHCNSGLCYRAISNIDKFPNGRLISFSKYENKDIKGSMLKNGVIEFDAIKELNVAKGRDDIAIKEYNRAKIYPNGIVIFQVNQKANTMNQLREYLKHHCKHDYTFEIVRVYRDDLFEMIDKGHVEQITLYVGLAPDNSFDAFDSDSNTGATDIEIKLKKPKDGFLKKAYLKSVLFAKHLKGFGVLDNGTITDAKAKIKTESSPKPINISLESYQLKEKKVFTDKTFYDMDPNKTFDELYNKHKDFLEEYAQRDTRYDK